MDRSSMQSWRQGSSQRSQAAAVLLGSALIAGCASSGGSPGRLAVASAPPTLAELQRDTVRRLAAECYRQHPGERLVYGGQPVNQACRDWAERRVRGPWPQSRRF
jgi:hypothetical protein